MLRTLWLWFARLCLQPNTDPDMRQGLVGEWLGSDWAAELQERGASLVRQQVPTALALAEAQLHRLAAQHNLTSVRGPGQG